MINQAVSHGAGSGPALPWGWMRNPRAGSESHGGVLWHTRVQKWCTLAHVCMHSTFWHTCVHARCLMEYAFVRLHAWCAQAHMCVCHLQLSASLTPQHTSECTSFTSHRSSACLVGAASPTAPCSGPSTRLQRP